MVYGFLITKTTAMYITDMKELAKWGGNWKIAA